jgi:DNA-binding NarL/FixJ family response regulator
LLAFPRVLLATNRPSVEAFFDRQHHHAPMSLTFVGMPIAERAVDEYLAEVEQAGLALIDLGADPDGGVRLGAALRRLRPDLRIMAILCCSKPTLPSHIQQLPSIGIHYWLDAEVCPEDLISTMIALVSADGSRTHVARHERCDTQEPARVSADTDRVLIELIARGKSDDEIGDRVGTSARAVRRHIERIRKTIGVRNRVELAAWAGARGLYRPV